MASQVRNTAYPDVMTLNGIGGQLGVSLDGLLRAVKAAKPGADRAKLVDDIDVVARTAYLLRLRSLVLLLEKSKTFLLDAPAQAADNGESLAPLVRALEVAIQYSNGFSSGKVESGVCLMAGFAALQESRDVDVLTKAAVFLPIYPQYEIVATVGATEFAGEVRRYREEIRAGLAKIQDGAPTSDLTQLRTTLVTLEAKPSPGWMRHLLTIAVSYLDVLLQKEARLDSEKCTVVKAVVAAVEDFAAGGETMDDALVSSMLYAIAQVPQLSARTRALDVVYRLTDLANDEPHQLVPEAQLNDAIVKLEAVKKIWEGACEGKASFDQAKDAVFELAAITGATGDYSVRVLMTSMGALSDALASARMRTSDDVALLGATTLLAVEDRLAHINSQPKGGRGEADAQRERVRAALSGVTAPGAFPLAEAAYRIQIVDEISADIASAEQLIEQVFLTGFKAAKREAVQKAFESISSALSFINLPEAAGIAHTIGQLSIAALDMVSQQSDVPIEDQEKLADAFIYLQRYIASLGDNGEDSEETLELLRGVVNVSPSDEVTAVALDLEANQDFCRDLELGDIFFEEALEVIDTVIRPGLAEIVSQSSTSDGVIDVRRGFHTLKGSARMVELINLGMVGQHLEFALNHLIEKKTPVSVQVASWLEYGCDVFSAAIHELKKRLPTTVPVSVFEKFGQEVQADQLVAACAFLVDQSAGSAAEAVSSVADVAAGLNLESEDVTIGSMVVTKAVYESFVSEAQGFYKKFEDGAARILAGDAAADEEMYRVIHSIAGMSVTVGLHPIAELAKVLETWCSMWIDNPEALDDAGRESIGTAVETLGQMIHVVAQRQMPTLDAHVVEGLVAVIDAVCAQSAGWVSTDDSGSEMSASQSVSQSEAGVEDPIVERISSQDALASHSDAAEAGSDQLAVEMLDRDRIEAERLELERAEVARAGSARIAAEQLAQAHADALRAEEARAEQITVEAARVEAERLERERQEALRIEAERAEAARLEREVAEAARIEAERAEKARVHAAQVEAERIERERAEAEKLEAELVELARAEAERIEAERIARARADLVKTATEDLAIEAAVDDISEQSIVSSAQMDGLHASVTVVGQTLDHAPESSDVSNFADLVIDTLTVDAQSGGAPTEVATAGEVAENQEPILESVRHPADGVVSWVNIVEQKEDEPDEEMFDFFKQEADGLFVEIDECLSGMAVDLSDKKLAARLKRVLHTLKGSANTVGARKIGALFHYLEELMEGSSSVTPDMAKTIQAGVDAGFHALEALAKGKSVDDALRKLASRAGIAGGSGGGSTAEEIPYSAVPDTITVLPESTRGVHGDQEGGTQSATVAKKARLARKGEDEDQLRVGARTVDVMINDVGEVSISRNRVGTSVEETKAIFWELSQSMVVLSKVVRQIELESEKQMITGGSQASQSGAYDHLGMDRFTRLQELTRQLVVVQNEIATHHQHANNLLREIEDSVASQNVAIQGLSSRLSLVRQVRVSSVMPALKRVVRQACRDTGKNGEIYFDADVSIDRAILNKITGPIEHILRNAVAHGIEAPEERDRAHKDSAGSIDFKASQDGSEVVIEIRDDGAGVNHARVLRRAIERGIVAEGEQLSKERIVELLFEPGFSTAESVTDIAGRGVGLDVVRSDISSLGGRVTITSEEGRGTSFTLRVPVALSVIPATSVSTNGHDYVIPVGFIDRMVRLAPAVVDAGYRDRKVVIQDENGSTQEYEFWGLWQLVGDTGGRPRGEKNSVLLLRGERIALHVGEVKPSSEYVFRPMGPQIATDSGIIGSTITSSGNASLVLDPSRLAKALRLANLLDPTKALDAAREPLILIVDDSLTVRSATARLVKKCGYRYAMASDGRQALERLREERADIVLMDVEMPVMNGFEATQEIRSDVHLKDTPIVMITSRAGEAKFREKAFEVGVNEYLGKPYKDDDLIRFIEQYVRQLG